jgi:hypothetical protein
LRRCRLRERKGAQTDTQTRARKLCRGGGKQQQLKDKSFLIDFKFNWIDGVEINAIFLAGQSPPTIFFARRNNNITYKFHITNLFIFKNFIIFFLFLFLSQKLLLMILVIV